MPLNVAVLGAGRRGTAHTEAVADLEAQARVVGIADIDEQRARSLASSSAPHAKIYTDAAALIEESRPDVVYITTPPPLHLEQTLAALQAGAHVVLEKPITLSVEEAEAIGEAADKAGKIVHICHQIRYNPGNDELRELLRGQRIALTHIWNYRKGPDIPGNWFRSWGGGHVVEWGIHYLDMCRYLLETEAVEVYARYADQILQGHANWDNWDAYSLTVQWDNGAVGAYASTYALKPELESGSGLVIIAEEGKLEADWTGATWITPDGSKRFGGNRGDGEKNLSRALFTAIETGDQSEIRQTFNDAMKTHRLVMAANESAVSGRVVRLA